MYTAGEACGYCGGCLRGVTKGHGSLAQALPLVEPALPTDVLTAAGAPQLPPDVRRCTQPLDDLRLPSAQGTNSRKRRARKGSEAAASSSDAERGTREAAGSGNMQQGRQWGQWEDPAAHRPCSPHARQPDSVWQDLLEHGGRQAGAGHTSSSSRGCSSAAAPQQQQLDSGTREGGCAGAGSGGAGAHAGSMDAEVGNALALALCDELIVDGNMPAVLTRAGGESFAMRSEGKPRRASALPAACGRADASCSLWRLAAAWSGPRSGRGSRRSLQPMRCQAVPCSTAGSPPLAPQHAACESAPLEAGSASALQQPSAAASRPCAALPPSPTLRHKGVCRFPVLAQDMRRRCTPAVRFGVLRRVQCMRAGKRLRMSTCLVPTDLWVAVLSRRPHTREGACFSLRTSWHMHVCRAEPAAQGLWACGRQHGAARGHGVQPAHPQLRDGQRRSCVAVGCGLRGLHHAGWPQPCALASLCCSRGGRKPPQCASTHARPPPRQSVPRQVRLRPLPARGPRRLQAPRAGAARPAAVLLRPR